MDDDAGKLPRPQTTTIHRLSFYGTVTIRHPTGVAADITTRAAPPPALKRKAGVGGLAPVPPPPKLHPSEPRSVPWKERVAKVCAAPRPKKKARRKK